MGSAEYIEAWTESWGCSYGAIAVVSVLMFLAGEGVHELRERTRVCKCVLGAGLAREGSQGCKGRNTFRLDAGWPLQGKA